MCVRERNVADARHDGGTWRLHNLVDRMVVVSCFPYVCSIYCDVCSYVLYLFSYLVIIISVACPMQWELIECLVLLCIRVLFCASEAHELSQLLLICIRMIIL